MLLDCIVASHEAEVQSFCIEKLLKMPVAYYSGCLSGEKTAQLNQGVAGFSQLIKILCNDVFATVLTAVCTLAQVLFHAPVMMAGIMLLYLVLTVVISAFQIRSQNGIREKIVHQKTALDGQICQSISNLELIRSMDAEEYEKHRLEPGVLDISHTEKKHHKYMGLFDCLKQLCKIVFQVTLLGVSVVLIGAGRMDGGAVITVCLLFQQLIKPIDEVYRFMDETASSLVKAKALLEVTASPSDEVFSRVSSGQPLTDGSVHLEQVLVTNPEKDKPLALYQDLTIPGGKKVALPGGIGLWQNHHGPLPEPLLSLHPGQSDPLWPGPGILQPKGTDQPALLCTPEHLLLCGHRAGQSGLRSGRKFHRRPAAGCPAPGLPDRGL